MPRPTKKNRAANAVRKKLRKLHGTGTLQELRDDIRKFANDRDWGKFHSPKNLSMALVAEASELLEHFLWLTEKQSRMIVDRKLSDVAEEIGDVLIYLIRIADQLGIDPIDAARGKLVVNARKYPVEKARGNAKKYTEFLKA